MATSSSVTKDRQVPPEPSRSDSASLPNDPAFLSLDPFGPDAQWHLQNHGIRKGYGRCGDAVAGADLRIVPFWLRTAERDGAPFTGDPSVVLAFLDTGILADHPDLHVLPVRPDSLDGMDESPDHGTKMAGLAAMGTGNGIGGAGVCGDCSVLDVEVGCLQWHLGLDRALRVPLGVTDQGKPRRLVAANASLAADPTLEGVRTAWTAYQAGTLLVASSGDWSPSSPGQVSPGDIPFALCVGGSTWEDRFWDAAFSCYDEGGTLVGPGLVDLAAPACGSMVSTFPYENPYGLGLYAFTSGQCSGAAALVTGAAGLLQSYAAERSALHQYLSVDDLAGLLTSTTRAYSADPTIGATCPPELCPRSFYGTGILSIENAAFSLDHAEAWRKTSVSLADGCEVEFQSPEFLDAEGRLWRQCRVTWRFRLPPRPDVAGATADLPRFIAWPLKAGSTTLCSYGDAWTKAACAESGIRDCALELDRETGRGTLTGYNFAEVRNGAEFPLVPWDELRMGLGYWAGGPPVAELPVNPVPAAGTPDVFLVGPNPARGAVGLRITLPSGTEGTVDVFDASGRRVRALFTGMTWAGEVRLRWDGKDEAGRAVPAGIYWVRARSQGRSAARAVVRVS